MTAVHDSSWRRLVAEAPELARAIIERFRANRHHVLGTIRSDGSPRLSGSEVEIDTERVGIGMMYDAHKLADIERDPRVEIHSAPLEDDLVAGDAKLSGLLVRLPPADDQPGAMFTLDVRRASLVRVVGDELEFLIWSATHGMRVQRRK